VFLQDCLIYRWIAGYLVRPLHPALALVAFVALGILVRIFWSPKRADDQPAPGTPSKTASAQQPDPAAQAAGSPAAATPGDSEHSEAGHPRRSRSTTGPLAEPTPGGSSKAHSPSEAGTVTSPGTPSGASHGGARGRRDPSLWIRAFLETGAVAFSLRPPEQLTKVTKDAIAEDPAKASSLGVALRWAEYAWFKVCPPLLLPGRGGVGSQARVRNADIGRQARQHTRAHEILDVAGIAAAVLGIQRDEVESGTPITSTSIPGEVLNSQGTTNSTPRTERRASRTCTRAAGKLLAYNIMFGRAYSRRDLPNHQPASRKTDSLTFSRRSRPARRAVSPARANHPYRGFPCVTARAAIGIPGRQPEWPPATKVGMDIHSKSIIEEPPYGTEP